MARGKLFSVIVATLCCVIGSAAADEEWCGRIVGGPPGDRDFVVDLSAAHAGVRFFGMQRAYSVADQALAAALEPDEALARRWRATLTDYANRLDSVCALSAETQDLPAARVEMRSGVAVIHPGTGPVELTEGTRAVVIDLRHLPDAVGLRAALETAVAGALASPVERPVRRVRRHFGMTDELLSPYNVYKNNLLDLVQPPVPATGTRDLPIALITGRSLPPEAAEFAGTLRIGRRAWIVGHDVFASVAEARWQGLGPPNSSGASPDVQEAIERRGGDPGGMGIAYRAFVLWSADVPWPDVIAADMREGRNLLKRLPRLGSPGSVPVGEAVRAPLVPMAPYGDVQPAQLDRGAVRAALVIAHGAARLFFPYFPVVGDQFDDRLRETVDALGPDSEVDRSQAVDVLRRLSEALHDNDSYVRDLSSQSTDLGAFPVVFDQIQGAPVAYRSLAAEVVPGDTLVSIDGRPAEEWFSDEYESTSAATDVYRFVAASYGLLSMTGPRALELRSAEGTLRTVTVNPYPRSTLQNLRFSDSLRGAGWLADLGAPDLYYINVSHEVLSSDASFNAALAQARAGSGLILDLRAIHGSINPYGLASKVMCQPFSSPLFRVPVLDGAESRSLDNQRYDLSPSYSFCGPVALLVGPRTVLGAENVALMFVDSGRAIVVGRPSAGTDGNVTGVQLPGALALTFTGVETLHADGSTFHGIGIRPDVQVEPEISDFPAGRDRVLEAAIDALTRR